MADACTEFTPPNTLQWPSYQITKNGLALQLTLQGTKYYKDDDLNK